MTARTTDWHVRNEIATYRLLRRLQKEHDIADVLANTVWERDTRPLWKRKAWGGNK